MNLVKLEEQLTALMHVTSVNRFHSQPTITVDGLAAHSYRVAMLCYILSEGKCSANLFQAALFHDMAEIEFGDIPSPSKCALSSEARRELKLREIDYLSNKLEFPMPKLTLAEERVLALADKFDGMLYCIHERRMGNSLIEWAYVNFNEYVINLRPTSIIERGVFLVLMEAWMEVGVNSGS